MQPCMGYSVSDMHEGTTTEADPRCELALAEIRRAKLRFGLLTGAVALLVFLILFQQSLAAGLLGSFTGGLENQSAEVLVYDEDARRSVDGSVVTPEQVDAVAAGRRRGRGRSRSARGRSPSDVGRGRAAATRRSSATSWAGRGAPTTLSDGPAPRARRRGGRECRRRRRRVRHRRARRASCPATRRSRSSGSPSDAQFNVQPTLFVVLPDLRAARRRDEPRRDRGAAVARGGRARVRRRPRGARRRDHRARSAGVEALDRATAVASLPGVSSIRQSFAIILGARVHRGRPAHRVLLPDPHGAEDASLTLLRAVGASSWFLLANLALQVAIVVIGRHRARRGPPRGSRARGRAAASRSRSTRR